MQNQYSMRSPAVKRLMKEAQELREPTEQYHVQPLDDNLFEWHFTIRGPADSDFDGGIYHGRIILPPDYPMKPPSIILLTPNGRFEVYKKICLSISGHHPESWQPSWSIRTALLAIIGFMPTHGAGAIGSLDYTPEERKVLAKKSNDWKCENCGCVGHILPPVTKASEKTTQEAKELASQIDFQGEKPKDGTQSSSSQAESISSSTTSSTTSATKSATTSTTESASATTNNGQSPQFPWNPFMANGAQSGMMTPPFGFPYPLPPPAATGNTMVPRFPMPFYAPPMLYPGFPLQNMGAWPQYPMTNLPSSSQSSACSASPGSSSTETSSTPVTSSQTLPSTNSSTHATEPASSSTQITSSASSLTSPISTATTSESLRQRRPAPTQNYRNAELPVHVRSNETFSLFLIIFLVCAIGLLVLRRLYVAFNWGFLNEEL